MKQSTQRRLRLMWAGEREELADIIYTISPMDTPFMRKGEAL